MKLKVDGNGNAVLQDGKPVYIHDDGKEVAIDVPATISKIGALNKEAQGHRERAEKAEKELKSFEGISDPDAARKALKTVENLDHKKLVDAGDVEKVKSEAIKAVRQEYDPIVKERDGLKIQLETHLVGGAFSRSKFISERFAAEGPAGVEIAQALFGSRLKVEDGKVVGYDAQGNKLYSRSRPGELADAEEAIELLVDAYPYKDTILKSSGASGSGAAPSGGQGVTPPKGNLGGNKAERTAALAARFPELNQR